MKIFLIENNHKKTVDSPVEISWTFPADSALSNAGKPFFIPEHEEEVNVRLVPAIKISRLGKSVAKKFSHRYYDLMSPALHFTLPALYRKLKDENLSTDPAISFDKAIFYGDYESYDKIYKGDAGFKLFINGNFITEWKVQDLIKDIDTLISEISKTNTIKIGDLVLPGETDFHKVKQGDLVEVTLDDKRVLSVKIK